MSTPSEFPLDEIVPPGERTEDLGTLHQERQRELERAQRWQRVQERLAGAAQPSQPGEPENPTPQLEDPSTPRPPEQGGVTAGDVVKDVGRGVIAAPREVLGGVTDALRNSAGVVKDLADLYSLPGVIYEPGKGLRFASGEEIAAAPGALETAAEAVLPEVEPSGTVTGGLVRGVSQFLTDFLAAGKLAPLKSLAGLGTAGRIAAPMLQGAIADFAAFDPQQQRLSNLVERFPALQNPVTEYLAAQPDDSGAEGRFKNAVEGLALGGLTDAFTTAVRKIRSVVTVKAAAGFEEPAVRQAIDIAGTQQSKLTDLVGDPAAPRLRVVQPEAAAADMPGEVFVNWSRIDKPDDVKSMIQDLADARAGNIDVARRDVRSWEATRLSAEQQNAWKLLNERKVGEAFNAEQSVAVREFWVRSGARVKELAHQVMTEDSELGRIAFRRQLAVHNVIQEQVIAARTETARALNAWRIQVGDAADFAGQMDQLRVLAQSDRDVKNLAQRVLQLSQAGNEKGLDKFLQVSGWVKGGNAIRQAYYGAMLSSPHTHARNFIGNTAALPLQMLERKVAAWTGRLFGQQNVPDGEAMAQLFGMTQGFQRAFRFGAQQRQVFAAARRQLRDDPEAARQLLAASDVGTAWRSVLTGETGIGMGRPEVPRGGAFTDVSEHLGRKFGFAGDPRSAPGRVAAFLDTVTTAPMRALSASDEVFKTISFDMEMQAQAFRKATREVGAGEIAHERFADRVTELVQNPDQYMRMASAKFAETSTFTNRPGEFAQAAAKLASKVPVLGRFVLPFRSTPFNIASFTFRRTPLAPFVRQWREDIAAGGATADLAWSQFLVGSAILTSMADLALSGHITGTGPADPAERASLQRSGWQQNSVRFGDRYYSYRGLEPVATSMGLAANAVDILRHADWEDNDPQYDELVIATTMAIAAQATSQQYMSGVSGFFEMMADPQRYGENWFERLATTPIPRSLALAAKVNDPTVRMATDVGESIRAQIPGLTDELAPARDVWGRPRTYTSGFGGVYDLFSPIQSRSAADAEPIDRELQKIEHYVGMPGKEPTVRSVKVDLRNQPKVYSRFVELAGNELKLAVGGGEKRGLKDTLNALVEGKLSISRQYERETSGPDGTKGDIIDDIVDSYRGAAREQLYDEFPWVRQQVDGELAKRREQLRLRVTQGQLGGR